MCKKLNWITTYKKDDFGDELYELTESGKKILTQGNPDEYVKKLHKEENKK